MKLKEVIIKSIGRSRSKFITYPLTFIAPEFIFNSFYNNLKKKNINWKGKKTCFTLSFDCDYSADIKAIPNILDIMLSYNMKASFASIGLFIERHKKIHQKIIDEGHEIVNHTYSHPNNDELGVNKFFNRLSIGEQKNEIVKCHQVCKKLLDYKPIGFRIPHFGPLYTPATYPILSELGYKYSSSTMALRTPNFGLPYYQKEILELPVAACPKHPFGIFDTYHSFYRSRFAWHKKDFFDVFRKLVKKGIETGAFINVYFDPQDIKYFDLNKLLDYVAHRKKYIWVTTYEKVAKWWNTNA